MRKCWVALLLIWGAEVHAYDSADFWVLTNPEPPFVVIDERRNMSGFVVEIVQGILTHAGIKQTILAAPWERVEQEARLKSNVLVFALARTPEREDHYHWITPITANVFSVHARKSLNIQIDKIDDLAKYQSISVLADDARHLLLKQYAPESIMALDSWQNALSSVLLERSQAIFFSDAGVAFFCQQPNNDCASLERKLMYGKTVSYLVLSKPGTDPLLAKRLKEAAIAFKGSEEFTQLTEFWLTKYKNEVPFPMHMEDGTINLWKK